MTGEIFTTMWAREENENFSYSSDGKENNRSGACTVEVVVFCLQMERVTHCNVTDVGEG